jgi:hypothetical protein
MQRAMLASLDGALICAILVIAAGSASAQFVFLEPVNVPVVSGPRMS